jgi:hypothetical protein
MAYVGGCQCGRIRYRADEPRDRASVCYCRMCQKASGGPFMAFVRFPASRVTWSAPPDIFASSNLVERGFCRNCGTPLSYRQIGGPNISLTINSLDDLSRFAPRRGSLSMRRFPGVALCQHCRPGRWMSRERSVSSIINAKPIESALPGILD